MVYLKRSKCSQGWVGFQVLRTELRAWASLSWFARDAKDSSDSLLFFCPQDV